LQHRWRLGDRAGKLACVQIERTSSTRVAATPWRRSVGLAAVLALGLVLATMAPRASAQSASSNSPAARAVAPRGSPPPSTWEQAEARMDSDGGARAVDLLLGATAAGGWIETGRGELAAVELAVLRRVRAWPPERQNYWTERAGALAVARLAAAGGDEPALASLVRELPATKEAGLAALRLHDAALERGQAVAAEAWLGRAATHGAAREAVAARRAHHGRRASTNAPSTPSSTRFDGHAVRALLARSLSGPRHQFADGVGRADGGCVAQHGDILCVARPLASGAGFELVEFDLRSALETRHGVELPRAHGSSGSPSVARPALVEGVAGGPLILAVAGRAEDERGNTLGCWRLSESGLEPAWSSLDARARLPELDGWTIEHAGTPLVVDGRVLDYVRAWPGRVDDTRVRGWLVARSLVDGAVLSARNLDEGPVERAALRSVGDLQPWRADQAPRPRLAGGDLWLPTGTGALWRVELAELEPMERLWVAPVARPRPALWTIDDEGWAPSEGGWRRLKPDSEASPADGPWPNLVELVGEGLGLERVDAASARLANRAGDRASALFSLPAGSRPVMLSLPDRVWVASHGRAYLLDEGLRRRQVIDLPGAPTGLPAGQDELGWIAVMGGAWLVRSGSLVFMGG